MKKLIFLFLAMLSFSNLLLAQSFEFLSYGVKYQLRDNVVPVKSKLIIKKNYKGEYNIIGYNHSDIQMNLTVKYFDNSSNTNYYKGTVNFGAIDYDCLIMSTLKLDEFIKGVGNKDYYVFYEDNEIQIFYDFKGVNPLEFRNFVSVYPINDSERILKEQKQIEEQKQNTKELENKRQIALQELEQKKQLALQEKIKAYLATRDEKYYSLEEYPSKYSQIQDEIKSILSKVIKENDKDISITVRLVLKTDYKGSLYNDFTIEGEAPVSLKQKIKKQIDTITLPQIIMFDKYTSNTKAAYQYFCTYSNSNCEILYNKKGNENIQSPCNLALEDIKSKKYPFGKYYSTVKKLQIGNYPASTIIKYNNFNGLGGASNALFSVFIPGLGNYFVNGGTGSILGNYTSPLYTTIAVLGFVGAGYSFKIESNKSYALYHSSNYQPTIDQYYDQANTQNKTAYLLFGTGAMIWVYDIIWTVRKGAANSKANRIMKNNLSFKPLIYDNSKMGIDLTYKF